MLLRLWIGALPLSICCALAARRSGPPASRSTDSRFLQNFTKTTGGSLNRMSERQAHSDEGSLLGRIEVIEAQPLERRSTGYDQLAEELLSELQRSDHESGLSDSR